MKKTFTMVTALLLLGAFGTSYGQSNSKSQAGGLPALAEEVAALRTLVQALQAQIEGDDDPYAGTYAVNLVETSLFGCGTGNVPGAPPITFPYFFGQGNSSISTRSASFEVESDGYFVNVPPFAELTNELRLSGFYHEEVRMEGDIAVPINADGSVTFTGDDDEVVRGQFSADGSLFSILIQGYFVAPSGCDDAYTISITGIKK